MKNIEKKSILKSPKTWLLAGVATLTTFGLVLTNSGKESVKNYQIGPTPTPRVVFLDDTRAHEGESRIELVKEGPIDNQKTFNK